MFVPGAARHACTGSGWRLSSQRSRRSSPATCAPTGRLKSSRLADWLGGGHGLLLTLFKNDDPRGPSHPCSNRRRGSRSRGCVSVAQRWRLCLRRGVPRRRRCGCHSERRRTGSNAVLADHIASDLTATVGGVEAAGADHAGRRTEAGGGDRTHPPARAGARRRVVLGGGRRAARADRRRPLREAGRREVGARRAWRVSRPRRRPAASGEPSAEAQAAGTDEGAREAREERPAGRRARPICRSCSRAASCRPIRDRCASLAASLASIPRRDRTDGSARLGKLGKEFGRFDPRSFRRIGVGNEDGDPGRGGDQSRPRRRRLTWGKEIAAASIASSRRPLPPGAARSPTTGRRSSSARARRRNRPRLEQRRRRRESMRPPPARPRGAARWRRAIRAP